MTQRLGTGDASTDLGIDQRQLLGQLAMADRQLLGYPFDGLRQCQTGFDADHQQIQGIGKSRAQ
ncbi:hypothetical protein D3C75_1181760 [compost metagenome]